MDIGQHYWADMQRIVVLPWKLQYCIQSDKAIVATPPLGTTCSAKCLKAWGDQQRMGDHQQSPTITITKVRYLTTRCLGTGHDQCGCLR